MSDSTCCSIPDCAKLAKCRTWCGMHYARWWRTGDPLNSAYEVRTAEMRFWEKVNKNGPVIRPELGNCWIWEGSCGSRSYGTFWAKGRYMTATRYSWEYHTGSTLTTDQFVCHRCDNPPCVRPDHHFLGDSQTNVDDMIRKGRKVIGRASKAAAS